MWCIYRVTGYVFRVALTLLPQYPAPPNGCRLACAGRAPGTTARMLITVACLLLAPLLSLSGQAAARRIHPPLPIVPKVGAGGNEAVTDVNGQAIPPYDTIYYFDQLIDHNDPSKGTFKVRYWTTWEYYKPGGPIILMTPGEDNADGTSPLHSIPEVDRGFMTYSRVFRLRRIPYQQNHKWPHCPTRKWCHHCRRTPVLRSIQPLSRLDRQEPRGAHP